jgi:hypothetical protein
VTHNPAGGPKQAQALVAAADHAFTHAVAHTSLVGGIILACGTIAVALVLPGHRMKSLDKADQEPTDARLTSV